MVERLPPMKDMARTPEEKKETVALNAVDAVPNYPYGLCISLCDEELDKLGLDDLQVGEILHLFCFAKVTSYSESDNATTGPHCRAELQITHIAAESEDEENEESDRSEKAEKRVKTLYKY